MTQKHPMALAAYLRDGGAGLIVKFMPTGNVDWKGRKQLELEWVEIQGGKFMRGLTIVQAEKLLSQLPSKFIPYERERLYREVPEQVIELEAFYISRFPITCEQYLKFAESDHRYSEKNTFSDESRRTVLRNLRHLAETQREHPVDTAWHYALAFCDWIGARLPTLAEWEKAARGTDGRLYPWGNEWDVTRGNFNLDRSRRPTKTSPVTAYPSGQSPYGVMDMMGNTYEWTLSTIFGSSGKPSTELVVCRGCSCDFEPEIHTPDWFRNRVTAILANSMYFGGAHLVGFRPVLDQWHKQYWPGIDV